MSRYERNKGILIPISSDKLTEAYAKEQIGKELYEWYDSYLDMFNEEPYEFGHHEIKGQLYKVKFEIEAGDEQVEFARVSEEKDGSIVFDTQHYNGGACWSEVVENEL